MVVITFQDLLRLRARQLGADSGSCNLGQSLGGHGRLLRNGWGTVQVPNSWLARSGCPYVVRLESFEAVVSGPERRGRRELVAREEIRSCHARCPLGISPRWDWQPSHTHTSLACRMRHGIGDYLRIVYTAGHAANLLKNYSRLCPPP